MGHQYWIGNFKTFNSGLLKQVGQLPEGVRRSKIQEHLFAIAELIESFENNPEPDPDLNLPLFTVPSGIVTP